MFNIYKIKITNHLRKKTKFAFCHLFDEKRYIVSVDENENFKPCVWSNRRHTCENACHHFSHSISLSCIYLSLYICALHSSLTFLLSLLCDSHHARAFPSPSLLVLLLNWVSLSLSLSLSAFSSSPCWTLPNCEDEFTILEGKSSEENVAAGPEPGTTIRGEQCPK